MFLPAHERWISTLETSQVSVGSAEMKGENHERDLSEISTVVNSDFVRLAAGIVPLPCWAERGIPAIDT